MAENTVQSLNKLLVDVPVGKGESFKSSYYSPEEGVERKTDYDNKVVFLHDSHEIFTRGDLFGVETTVGSNNSFGINGTSYTLTIRNGQLNIEKYVPSAINYVRFDTGSGTITPGAEQSCEYGTSYQYIKVTATPSNAISYSINNGTTNILLVAIQANNGSNSLTYVYGGAYTMSNGVITHIDNIGDIVTSDYKNSIIQNTLTINKPEAQAPSKSKDKAAGIPTTGFNVSVSTDVQSGALWYHELGTNTVKKQTFNSTAVTKSSTVTVWKGYFLWHLENYKQPTTIVGTTQFPTRITTVQGTGKYAWLAIPVAPTYDGSRYIKPVFNTGGFDGGWGDYKVDGVPVTFTHYGDTYYVYRTEEAGLGENTWTITY